MIYRELEPKDWPQVLHVDQTGGRLFPGYIFLFIAVLWSALEPPPPNIVELLTKVLLKK